MVAASKPPLPPPRSSPPPPIPLPLAPRIDRLDSIMKVLEDQKSVAVHSVERHMPMDMAVREAQLKGSLMDRVRSLENRLLQLCFETESRGKSLPDTPLFQALKGTSWSQGECKKTGSSFSSHFQTKQLPLPSQIQSDKIKAKRKSKSEQKKSKNEADELKKQDKEHKSVTTKKKAKPSTWFHLKLLGC